VQQKADSAPRFRFLSGLVASKSDDQLFFIETGQADADGTSSRPLTRKERARAKVRRKRAGLQLPCPSALWGIVI
jgi:hypothetical protein